MLLRLERIFTNSTFTILKNLIGHRLIDFLGHWLVKRYDLRVTRHARLAPTQAVQSRVGAEPQKPLVILWHARDIVLRKAEFTLNVVKVQRWRGFVLRVQRRRRQKQEKKGSKASVDGRKKWKYESVWH